MTDILGPANAPFAVTARPTDTRSAFGVNDTWFKDCTSSVADDGTDVQAGWLNKITAVLRNAIRGNGNTALAAPVVTEDDTDDALLLKAMQYLIQRGQAKYADDTGTADALILTLSPAAKEYKKGTVYFAKKGAADNATTTPVANINGLGNRTITDRRGNALAPGDLKANCFLILADDGTNLRYLGTVSADLGALHVGFNRVPIVNTTRTVYSGVTGFSSTFSSGTYAKKSGTSKLSLKMSTNLFDGGTGANAAVMRVAINGVNYEAVGHVSSSATSSTAANAEHQILSLPAGNYAYTVTFGRYDGTAWTTIVNPTQAADNGYLPVFTPTAVTFEEIEP